MASALRHYFLALISILLVAPLGAAEPQPTPTTPSDAMTPSWHQFRGAWRSGLAADTGLARSWPEGGPAIRWQRPLGEGFASLAIADGRLFTSFSEADQEILVAFDSASGEEIWRRELGPKFEEFFGNGPRSTPTIDGETVYAVGSRGHLMAVGAGDGDILWQVDLHQVYPITQPQTLTPVGATPPGPQLPVYGYAGSPLVVDDLLVVEAGARGGKSFIALDKHSGALRWAALDTEIGYSSPIVVNLEGQRQIIALPGSDIVALSPEGELLWRHPWAWTTSQPLFVPPNRLLVSAENDAGALMLQISSEGKAEEVWRSPRLKNAWNSSIEMDGYIYGFDNATLRCLRAEDGALMWAQRGLGKGNLIHADGLLIVLTDKGKVVLAEADGQGFESKGEIQALSGRCWTPPALADGTLYVRNHEQLVALDLRPQTPDSKSLSNRHAEPTDDTDTEGSHR